MTSSCSWAVSDLLNGCLYWTAALWADQAPAHIHYYHYILTIITHEYAWRAPFHFHLFQQLLQILTCNWQKFMFVHKDNSPQEPWSLTGSSCSKLSQYCTDSTELVRSFSMLLMLHQVQHDTFYCNCCTDVAPYAKGTRRYSQYQFSTAVLAEDMWILYLLQVKSTFQWVKYCISIEISLQEKWP